MTQWVGELATDAMNLILERLDRLCEAAERIADAVEGEGHDAAGD
jgi:hypothetical protein